MERTAGIQVAALGMGHTSMSRRIEGWTEHGAPIGGLRPQTKEQRITSMAAHYGALADSVATSEFKQAQDEVELIFQERASKGARTFIFYPSKLVIKYKKQITDWLIDDGVIVNWSSDQRDGNSIQVSF